jgi:hypothetical protein
LLFKKIYVVYYKSILKNLKNRKDLSKMTSLMKLKAHVESLEHTHSTQVGLTRTRAALLTVKKLSDTIRKELLLQGKQMKENRKDAPTPVLSPVSPDSSPISSDAMSDLDEPMPLPLMRAMATKPLRKPRAKKVVPITNSS